MYFNLAIFALFSAAAISAAGVVAVCLEDVRDERKCRARILR